MKLYIQRFYGGFIDSYKQVIVEIDDSALTNNLVLWLSDDGGRSSSAYINLLFIKNEYYSDLLLNLCHELRLHYIYAIHKN